MCLAQRNQDRNFVIDKYNEASDKTTLLVRYRQFFFHRRSHKGIVIAGKIRMWQNRFARNLFHASQPYRQKTEPELSCTSVYQIRSTPGAD